MKIQYALMSCTAHARYVEYWPLVAAAWLNLGIKPVCLFIPDNPAVKLPEAPGGIVHTIPPLAGLDLAIQGLILRLWGGSLYPDAIVTTADIDAIPLSKHFLGEQLAAYPDHAYIHLRHAPGDYNFYGIAKIPGQTNSINRVRYIASNFNIAKGATLHRVWDLAPDWQTSCKKTVPYFLHKEATLQVRGDPKKGEETCYGHEIGYAESHSARPFYGDELYLSLRLHHANYRPIFYLSYQPNHRYKGYITQRDLFRHRIQSNGHYTFAHFSPLRYSAYQNLIAYVVTAGRLPNFYRILGWYLRCIKFLYKKIKFVGPLLSLGFVLLSCCVFRLMTTRHIPSNHKEYRTILRRQLQRYPLIKHSDQQLARVRHLFAR